MKELLKQWAELCPDECRYNKFIPGWTHPDTGEEVPEVSEHFEFLVNGGEWVPEWSDLHLQATMQAIEARGLKWELSSFMGGQNIKWYCAVIQTDYPTEDESSESPAHALLSAYLQAVKSTKEVS